MLTRLNFAGMRKLTVAVVCPLPLGRPWSRGQSNTNAAPQAADWTAFQKTVQPFPLAKHCFECHGDKESGEVRPGSLSRRGVLAKGWGRRSTRQWQPLRRSLCHALPRKKAQPTSDEIKPVLAWMETFVGTHGVADPGRPRSRGDSAPQSNRVQQHGARSSRVITRPADDFPPDNSGLRVR